MNRVFAALLSDEAPPRPVADHIEDDPVGAYRDSAARLQAAFEQPGVLERTYRGPLGEATGAERRQIRLHDLLSHGWDPGTTRAGRSSSTRCRRVGSGVEALVKLIGSRRAL